MAKGHENGQRNAKSAVAYYRTSSASNVGENKDSLKRQQEAVAAYAKRHGIAIAAEFYDAGVKGTDQIDDRPGFAALLDRIAGNGVGVVLVEEASRFARDLAVQMTGHELLKRLGVDLVPANAPEHFLEDTPTAVMVRQILGAVSQFEKANLVLKLKGARARKKAATGRCEGRKPVPDEVVSMAKRLGRKNPKTGERRSLRVIAADLALAGFTVPNKEGEPSGNPYQPGSIKLMLARKPDTRAAT
jgi:DNA invertase Pin-like site-specific DNA recombinase